MSLLAALIQVYTLVIFARVIFSWVPVQHRQNEFYLFVLKITEPVLAPIRRILPSMGGLDLSPLIVIVILQAIRRRL
jgi:YggT family protein